MQGNKKRAVEGIQALLLRNYMERDYLDGALNAAAKENFTEARMFIELVGKLERGEVDFSGGN